MRHLIFEENDSYKVALLIKQTSFNGPELRNSYVAPLHKLGVPTKDIIGFTLQYETDKVSVKYAKAYLEKLLPALVQVGVSHIYCADSSYFKVLTGVPKTEIHHGYPLPCKIKGYESLQVILGMNYQALIYNPDLKDKLQLGLKAVAASIQGNYQALGTGIIHSAHYPENLQEIAEALEKLHSYPSLTCDIEGFSLRFNEAGIGTIAFAWDQHNGIAFPVDFDPIWNKDGSINPKAQANGIDIAGYNGYQLLGAGINPQLRQILKMFFESYKGELTFHNAPYDIKILIYELWMKDLLDTKGLLEGLDVISRNFHDTKIIAYLATNSTAGNVLGLKPLAHEFAGNWAKDEIKDIRKIKLPELLQYNLVDCLSTHYVRNKFEPVMVQDNQAKLYQELMMPSLKLIIQMELTGMPLNPKKVQEVKQSLEGIQAIHLDVIRNAPLIKMLETLLTEKNWEDDYEDRKAKAKNPLKIVKKNFETYPKHQFNPNSGPQLQKLLYEQMGLPVIDLTDKKAPATGQDTLEKLINHTAEPAYKAIITALMGYADVSKILNTFIPAFERAIDKGDGIVWLHGSFNLGGTVSGRLSSSDPNLQNLPATSTYGKLIKSCFQAPEGWLFCGADFNSLEDYISALTTKDPNKLKVYTDGFDGHCLRAFSYFRDQCPDIVDTVESINSMKKKYPELRQDSKVPTFALTYQGTWHTLVKNLGLAPEKAQEIEARYHELYKVSDQYIQDRLEQACKDGYTDVAFGLRVRTPLLKQVIWGTKIPKEAAAEGRTAGNAMGQSYGLLNNRAAVDFWQKVWASKYRYDILPVALIHDAVYGICRNDVEVVEWFNRELIKSMQWQELPEIQHPTVKLGAALDIFWPDWAHPTTLPNNASQEDIINLCIKTKEELNK